MSVQEESVMGKTALATRAEVAEYLRVPTQTLHQWASDGTGPPYVKIGNRARYDWQDVHAWVATHPRGPRETVSLEHYALAMMAAVRHARQSAAETPGGSAA